MTDVSLGVRAKRKRGRPRKDSNLSRDSLQSPDNSSFMKPQGGAELLYPSPVDAAKKPQQQDCTDEGMVGSMVYGVVEGSFDAGYLISVRIGNNLTPFRGVVFQPRKVVGVTPANDIAPQAKMFQRREIQVPVYDTTTNNSSNHNNNNLGLSQSVQPTKQPVVRPLIPQTMPPYSHTGSSSNMEGKLAPQQFTYGNLRMVEEDQVMQAFEVSISSNLATNGEVKGATTTFPNKGSINQEPESAPSASNLQLHHNPMESAFEIQQDQMICREAIDRIQEMTQTQTPTPTQTHSPQAIKTDLRQTNLYYNESRTQDVNFHENLFSRADSREAETEQPPQNMKQMAAEAQQASSIYPTMGFHQALVAGNPLLLPPDLIGEPLDFMMDRPKTPTNCKNSDEVQSRLVTGGDRFHGVGDDGMAASSEAAPSSYKLELATPQSGLNTRIADMDFVLANAHQITPTDDNS